MFTGEDPSGSFQCNQFVKGGGRKSHDVHMEKLYADRELKDLLLDSIKSPAQI